MYQIETKDCTYTYQSGSVNAYPALHHINLQICKGEMIALIGHGGSGKSTLASILAGLFQPQSGKVTIDGNSVPKKGVFSEVSLVFQYPEQQFFGKNVMEEVAFGPRNFGIAEEQIPRLVNDALEKVGLDPEQFCQRSPFALSGGQKRRVCIACMLAVDPQIIILDEPTAGLDEGGQIWMRELALELNKQGKTIIWISHDMAQVAQFAKRVIVLEKGKIIMDDIASKVFCCEQELKKAGLDIPKAAYLVQQLKAKGWKIPAKAITVEGAFSEINAYLGGGDHAK